MDMSHAARFTRAKIRAGDYADCTGATAVIVTAGVNQKPGQTRMDLARHNYALFQQIIPAIAAAASDDTVLVVATNPVDVLTHAAARLSGFPPERVIGTGTALDSTRFRHELGRHYGVSPASVHAVIVGEHGDTQLPVWSLATIAGMRLRDYCRQADRAYDEEGMHGCAARTREAAYEMIRRKGKTNYGVASVLVSVVEPLVTDADSIVTVSRVGSYAGVDDVALSMPCKINCSGVHLEAPLLLDAEEEEALRRSAQSIKDTIMSL